ncbi:hypothetical protein J8273_3917 [Carpediemonas membranifera]|uniref:Uncharacterized protein n=1 Tax=Carpediemonas membranifera TaxID=201153 RepID=A0A8J6DZY1_9EUKA|nr:hypothetical protein J8273_3917 [Carpediemonas membranifera]|eukprot:KAG9394284.1 hypothetical protein J8273_3917 [Carpediemonas membranifera]
MVLHVKDQSLVQIKPRRLSPDNRKKAKDIIAELTQQGIVTASKGPFASPIVLPHNLFSTEWDAAEWGDKRIVEFKQSLQEVLRTLEDSVREGTSARSQIETKGVEVGDYVLWKHENPKKLDCQNRGPWKIHEVLPNHKVKLQSIVTGDIRVTHVDKLMPFETDLEETQMKQLAESDKEQFEIEKIEKFDWKTGMVTIKWKNYDERTEQHLRSVSHVEEVKRRARKARKNLANYV